MCGNGIRSLMMFARQLGVVTDHCICETKERRLELWHKGGRVTVDMGEVISYSWSAQAEVAGKTYEGAWLNTGVPHVRFGRRGRLYSPRQLALFVPSVADAPVAELGRTLRYHPNFKPSNGVNVNFIERLSASEIRVRTYERGVEVRGWLPSVA